MTSVAVVILNYNGRSYLEQFLPKVIEYNPAYSKVYVADNDSTDDSVSYVRQKFPQVEVIINPSNGGYAKGYNDCLKHVKEDIYVLLNSDVEVTPSWIEPVVKMMEEDPQIACAQPKLLDYKNRELFEYAGAAGGFIDKFCYPFCRGRIFDSVEKDIGQYNDSREIFWASGACLFIRRDSFNSSGGLDEDFFAHMEEIDLCWRIKNQGMKVYYCPESVVYHVGGGTLSKINPRKTYLNFRNNLFLIFKNHPSEYFFIKLWLRMNLDGLAGVKFFFAGDFAHCWAVIKAHYSFYFSIPKLIRKRKELKAIKKVDAKTGVFTESIVWKYYVGRIKQFSKLDQSKIG